MFTYELSLFQRILLIWLFIFCGLVLALQAAKQYVERPAAKWRLTAETKCVSPIAKRPLHIAVSRPVLIFLERPYWYTFYVLEAFLLVQITYRVLMLKLGGVLGGYEETLLNGLWMGLLGLECLMVAGVALKGALRAVRPREKVKAQ
jgi:hypothetical protein